LKFLVFFRIVRVFSNLIFNCFLTVTVFLLVFFIG